MSQFQPGEVVDITIRGARVVLVQAGNRLVYTTLAGGEPVEHELHIGRGWPNHIVSRANEPAPDAPFWLHCALCLYVPCNGDDGCDHSAYSIHNGNATCMCCAGYFQGGDLSAAIISARKQREGR